MIDHAIPKAPGEERIAAVTEIWRRETFGRYAVVEARPHTGRLHQIRRHLKHIACPLIGDVRYGKGEHNRLWREKCESAPPRAPLDLAARAAPRRRRARGRVPPRG